MKDLPEIAGMLPLQNENRAVIRTGPTATDFDVIICQLEQLRTDWSARQEDIQADYWKDQRSVSTLECAIQELDAVIAQGKEMQ